MQSPLFPGGTYHIFNRAMPDELLFRCGDNYRFFLSKYLKYIAPISRTYAFCLMPNHFHFALKIKSKIELRDIFYPKEKDDFLKEDIDFSLKIDLRFSNFYNSYAKAYNKMYNRSGKLFLPSHKKRNVSSVVYLRNLIQYIHYNPVHHGFVSDPYDWTFSSVVEYQKAEQILIDKPSIQNLFSTELDYIEKPKVENIKNLFLDLEY